MDSASVMERSNVDNPQATLDYQHIQKVIEYLEQHYTKQPSLKQIADTVHLSEFHFERMFTRWAGTTPQRFMRYLTSTVTQKVNLSRG